ncbi:MAG: glycosyltransferase [Candidatus Omnitrophica bacterium]|nr:glycosyltransferase [Candidatus Omnitrophota bacterium]
MNIKPKLKTITFKDSGEIDKSDALILTIVFLMFLCVIYFNPRLLSLLVGEEPFFAKISVIIFVISLDMMWLYGIYHCAHIVFSYFFKTKIFPKKLNPDFSPAVAVLYMTRNDFSEQACITCINQDYKNYQVYICDDSDDQTAQKKIDAFVKNNKINVQILRRRSNRGYKAGNINDALKSIDEKYQYVAVADADSIFPEYFLKKIMPYFTASSKIAFVQAMQKSLKNQKGYLGKTMLSMVDIHWQHYMTLKNQYGFVMWYGHGAVLKRSIIEEIGGIPEVVTEDLSFSSKVRGLGYYGVVAGDVESVEEFPETLEKFRRRNRKWVRGTYEYLRRLYPQILFSKKIPWFEKADIFISAFALLQAIPFLMLVFTASFIMPFYYAKYQINGPLFLVPPLFYDDWLQVILKTRYNVFWLLDFYIIMLIVIFFPLIPAVIDMWSNKRKMLRYIAASSFLHLSILLDSAKEVIMFIVTGKTYFPVTNNQFSRQENKVWLAVEFMTGIYLMIFAVWTYNLWLVALGMAFVLTPLLIAWGERRLIQILVTIPFTVTAVIMICIGVTIIQNIR